MRALLSLQRWTFAPLKIIPGQEKTPIIILLYGKYFLEILNEISVCLTLAAATTTFISMGNIGDFIKLKNVAKLILLKLTWEELRKTGTV